MLGAIRISELLKDWDRQTNTKHDVQSLYNFKVKSNSQIKIARKETNTKEHY